MIVPMFLFGVGHGICEGLGNPLENWLTAGVLSLLVLDKQNLSFRAGRVLFGSLIGRHCVGQIGAKFFYKRCM
jgi:hypothetical protein